MVANVELSTTKPSANVPKGGVVKTAAGHLNNLTAKIAQEFAAKEYVNNKFVSHFTHATVAIIRILLQHKISPIWSSVKRVVVTLRIHVKTEEHAVIKRRRALLFVNVQLVSPVRNVKSLLPASVIHARTMAFAKHSTRRYTIANVQLISLVSTVK
jgi:hypothetical protein